MLDSKCSVLSIHQHTSRQKKDQQAEKDKIENGNRTRQSNERGVSKVESDKSPEIPDRGETSDIPGLPLGASPATFTDILHLIQLRHKIIQSKPDIMKPQGPSTLLCLYAACYV